MDGLVTTANPARLAAKPLLSDRLLFVDGLSRSGKKLTCKVVSHLEGVEYFQYASIVENTAYTYYLGQLDQETAARFIQVNLEEFIYNRAIGRNLNLRDSDETCINKSANPAEYTARSEAPDGIAAMRLFDEAGRIPLFHTHSVLAFVEVLFAAFPGSKVIHVTRHPIDIAEDFSRRRGGERWGDDALLFSIMAETANGLVPWYAADWSKAYVEMTPAERCIETVVRNQARDREILNAVEDPARARIFQFAFEHLISAPATVIDRLSEFTGRAPHHKMNALLESEKCPGTLPVAERRERLEKLERTSSSGVIDRLLAASRNYEREWELEPVRQ